MIRGFPEAPFTEAATGAVTGVKNLPFVLWNSALDASSHGFLGLSGAVDFDSYKVGTYGCDTRISCSWSRSTTTALTLAPGAFAAPFRAGSALSIGSRGGHYFTSPSARNLLQDLFAMKKLKGDTDIASGTAFEATKLGRAWVNGNNVQRLTSVKDGVGWTDGIRTFRLQWKPRDGVWKANFQENTRIFNSQYKNWQTMEIKNVHMVIKNMKPLK